MEKLLKISDNPIVLQNLSIMRDKSSSCEQVRTAVRRITRCLLYEAAKNLPVVEREIHTPLAPTKAKVIDPDIKVIVSPILRAGLVFMDDALDILPQAVIRHIGMYRDEETLQPVWYYNKIPTLIESPQKNYVYVTDPMLATGNSLIEAVKLFTDKGIPIENIRALCLIAAPQGVRNVCGALPGLEIFMAALDEGLDERGYIVPGMGDAGDRIFNT